MRGRLGNGPTQPLASNGAKDYASKAAVNKTPALGGLYGLSARLITIAGVPYQWTGTAIQALTAGTTDAAPPAPPSAPTISAAAGAGSVTLTLSALTATSRTVTRTVNSVTTALAVGSATSYTDTGLTGGLLAVYAAYDSNATGDSATATASATPTAGAAPSAPVSFVAVGGNNQVAMTWATPPAGLTSINLTRTGGAAFSPPTLTTSQAAYTDATAVNGTAYTYTLYYTNGSGTSTGATAGPVTPAVPSTPPNTFALNATPGTAGTGVVALSWPSDTVTSQALYRDGTPLSGLTAGQTSYNDTTTPGTTPTYTLARTNGAGTTAALAATSAPVDALANLKTGASHLYLFTGPSASLTDNAPTPSTYTGGNGGTSTSPSLITAGLDFNGTTDIVRLSNAPTLGTSWTMHILVSQKASNSSSNHIMAGIRMVGGAQTGGIQIKDQHVIASFAGASKTLTVLGLNGLASTSSVVFTDPHLITLRYDGTRIERLQDGEIWRTLPATGTTDTPTTPQLSLGALVDTGTAGGIQFAPCTIQAVAIYPATWKDDLAVRADLANLETLTGVRVKRELPGGRDSSDPYGPYMHAAATGFPENTYWQFRKLVTYSGSGAYKVRFAGSGELRVFVNGVLALPFVGRGISWQVRPREIDLAPYLTTGSNAVVIEHYNRGRSASAPFTDRLPGAAVVMVYDTVNGAAGLNSGTSWKVRAAPEYTAHTIMQGDASGPTANASNRYAHAVILNAGSIDSAIHTTGYNDSTWASTVLNTNVGVADSRVAANPTTAPTVTVHAPTTLVAAGGSTDAGDAGFSTYGVAPMAQRIKSATLTASPAASVAVASWNSGTNTASLQSGTQDAYVTLQFGRPAYGTLRLDITSSGTGVLDVAVGEDLPAADGKIDPTRMNSAYGADRVNLAAGTYTVRIGYGGQYPRGGTALHLVARGTSGAVTVKATIEQAAVIDTALPSLTIADTTLQGYFGMAAGNLLAHKQDVSLDHTVRDNGQWTMDGYVQMRALQWIKGDNPYRRLLLTHARDSFATTTPRPSPFPPVSGAGNIDWGYTLIWALLDEYRWTGDLTFMQRYLPFLNRFMDSLPSGVQTVTTNTYGDFTNLSDAKNLLLVNAQHLLTLRRLATLNTAAGFTAAAASYTAQADGLQTTMQGWRVAAGGGLPAHPEYTATAQLKAFQFLAQMTAVEAGAIPSGDVAALTAFLMPQDGSLPTIGATSSDWALWVALAAFPSAARAATGQSPYAWIKAVVAPFVANGYISEARSFGVTTIPTTNHTRTHGWTGAGIAGFVEGVLGASLATGQNLSVAPVTGLPDMDMTLYAPKGLWRAQKAGSNWTLTAPTSGPLSATIGATSFVLAPGASRTLSE